VIYVCSLSDISVIVCTDMVNVYNRTSWGIKDPTVHCTNVCESRSRPFTDAETQHIMYELEYKETCLFKVKICDMRLMSN